MILPIRGARGPAAGARLPPPRAPHGVGARWPDPRPRASRSPSDLGGAVITLSLGFAGATAEGPSRQLPPPPARRSLTRPAAAALMVAAAGNSGTGAPQPFYPAGRCPKCLAVGSVDEPPCPLSPPLPRSWGPHVRAVRAGRGRSWAVRTPRLTRVSSAPPFLIAPNVGRRPAALPRGARDAPGRRPRRTAAAARSCSRAQRPNTLSGPPRAKEVPARELLRLHRSASDALEAETPDTRPAMPPSPRKTESQQTAQVPERPPLQPRPRARRRSTPCAGLQRLDEPEVARRFARMDAARTKVRRAPAGPAANPNTARPLLAGLLAAPRGIRASASDASDLPRLELALAARQDTPSLRRLRTGPFCASSSGKPTRW